jgi:transposase-like protein
MKTTNTTIPTTLIEAIRYFADPDICLAFMRDLRWPHGVECPHCGSEKVTFLANARLWKCHTKHPKQKFSVKVGTIFEDSPIGLDKWLAAVWMIANCKNGISSYEIHRELGVTQKTAWFMMHRVRLAMQTGSFKKFSGQVEADETYIGGAARNMHWRKKQEKEMKGRGSVGKTAVMGLLERHPRSGSLIKLTVVPDTKWGTLQTEVRENVARGTEMHTDAHQSYTGLEHDYLHRIIDHAETYVKGHVHTNGIENFWSLLKRGLKGTYVSVEPFHLFRYLDEQSFRFNTRRGTNAERFAELLQMVAGRRLTYEKLIGKEPQKGLPSA